MSRRNVARLVMVAWIAALAWLAQRQLFPGEASSLTAGAARLSPDARYYRVDAGTLQLGVMNLTWDTLATGFTVNELLALDLPAGDAVRRHLRSTDIVTTRALTLRSAVRIATSPSGRQEVRLEVVNDSSQAYSLRSGDRGVVVPRISRDGAVTLPELLPLRLAFGGRLAGGEALGEEVADLERRATGRIEGRVAGDSVFILPDSVEFDTAGGRWRTVTLDTVSAWRLELVRGGLPERWWVDGQGRLVRLETAFGVTLQRAPFDYTHTLYRDSLRLGGVVPRMVVSGVRSLAASGIRLDTMATRASYRLARVDGPVTSEQVAALSGGMQQAEGAVVTITRGWPDREGEPPAGHFPGRPITGRLRLLADTAFAGARTGRDSVIALTRWIARRFAVDTNTSAAPEPGLAPPPAALTPDAMAGLAVSLAQAGGFPARPVNGLAVTEGGLLAHGWAEIWIGGDWVPVDPASGHAPASARLLRVAVGGLGRPFETLLRAAALRVEPLTPDGR